MLRRLTTGTYPTRLILLEITLTTLESIIVWAWLFSQFEKRHNLKSYTPTQRGIVVIRVQ